MLETISQPHNILYFANKIRNGELVAFPTETVYGLGADTFNEIAVRNIFKVKNRPADNPLIVHVPEKAKVLTVARELTETEIALYDAFAPGPLTVLLKKRESVPHIVTAGSPLVGVRIPNHALALEFLAACNTPVAAPSANKSGKPSATHHQHVIDAFGDEVPNVIRGGKTTLGVESTVVLVKNEEEIVVMRQGAISLDELMAEFPRHNVHLVNSNDKDITASPGTRYRHYAPKGEVVVVPFTDGVSISEKTQELVNKATKSNRKVAAFCFSASMIKNQHSSKVFDLGNNASMALQNLFDYLLKCDQLDVETIVVQLAPNIGAGLTFNERVLRAAAQK